MIDCFLMNLAIMLHTERMRDSRPQLLALQYRVRPVSQAVGEWQTFLGKKVE